MGMVDNSMWANQTKYFETGDGRQFDATLAYGHPGGTVILGTLFVHKVVPDIKYNDALVIFLCILNGLIIASITCLCFILRPNNLWWLTSAGMLSLDRLYEFATPPSVVVTLLLVLFTLITLYIYEQKNTNLKTLLIWGFIAGLSLASRTDISFIFIICYLLLLLQNIDWRKLLTPLVAILLTFTIFDPYMWFMPIRHISDLISKVIYHYENFYMPFRMSHLEIVSISFLALVSMFLATTYLVFKKKLPGVLPARFSVVSLIMTTMLYSIFLTSRYQAIRYFLPIIFTWQLFLPLFVFPLIEMVDFSFLKSEKNRILARKILMILFILLLIGFPLFYIIDTIRFNSYFYP